MSIFLRAKAWQIFFFIFALPFILQTILAVLLIASGDIQSVMPYLLLIAVFSVSATLGWSWAIGTALNSKVRSDIRLNSGLFRSGIILAFGCSLTLAVWGLSEDAWSIRFDDALPFSLPIVLGLLYGDYFISKNLIMAERQVAVSFKEAWGVFRRVTRFPAGIWYLQPKVNRLCAESEQSAP